MTSPELVKLCNQIIDLDKTPEYGYGSTEQDRNNNGDLPGAGARWATPAELCQDVLRRMED